MKPSARSSIRHRAIASIVLACLGCGVYLLSLSGRAPSASKPTSNGKSVVDVICSTADLAVFCKVIQSATRSPHVARLMDPQLHATVFAPTDRAFNEDEARLGQLLGVSGLAQLLTSPRVAAELVASHVITDHIVKEAQLLQERLFHNLLGHTLEVDASTLDGGLHIRGPASSVRLCSGPAPQVPLQASASIIYRVEGVLAARFPALPSFRAAMR
ncbi:hypothetical protein V8C86DRAFT_2721272 [Haematococcus lacustris]